LNEATSHLDIANERLIGEAVKSLRLTRIMIAHRPQTIAVADRVVRLEAGKFLELREGEVRALVCGMPDPCDPNLSHVSMTRSKTSWLVSTACGAVAVAATFGLFRAAGVPSDLRSPALLIIYSLCVVSIDRTLEGLLGLACALFGRID